jgi:hypothetical protein
MPIRHDTLGIGVAVASQDGLPAGFPPSGACPCCGYFGIFALGQNLGDCLAFHPQQPANGIATLTAGVAFVTTLAVTAGKYLEAWMAFIMEGTQPNPRFTHRAKLHTFLDYRY